MKVVRRAVTSIVGALAVVAANPRLLVAAEAATCGEEWRLCINDAAQKDGFFERTKAEQACNWDWYNCVKREAFGA
ncbi:MAG TPA: hypothetical protein VF039_13120 [Longimicrobiales bacterium]